VSLFAELRRRNVLRAAVLYVGATWALAQGIAQLSPAVGLPDMAARWFLIAAAIGFPLWLAFAWLYEWTPQGLKRESEIAADASIVRSSSRKLDRAIIVVLAIAVVLLLTNTFVWKKGAGPGGDAAAAIPDKSIAVLPFVNMSGDARQEYFSDGMSEELLNALAQVKDLKVAGRTSSFYFKGKNEDLRSIGKTLGVANILEGSVRQQGDKVRITAQLIRVADDMHRWSHAYDGDLSDVFQLQEDIARAITDQLKVALVGEQKTRLVPVATTSTEAHALYLRATDALNRRDYKVMGDAIGWLNRAVALDPNFAVAHAQLAMIHAAGWTQYGASHDEAQKQAQIALALDPKLAEAEYALAFVARQQRRFLDARMATDRSLELAPDDASAIFYDAELLIMTGYTRRGVERLDRALAIDPMLPNALHWRALQYLFADDTDAAERTWQRAGEAGLSYAAYGFAEVAKARGDYAKARALLLPAMLNNPGVTTCLKTPSTSLPIYIDGAFGGDAAARAKALAVVEGCLAAKPDVVPLWSILGLLKFEQPERALRTIEQGPTSDDAGVFIYFWIPQNRAVRELPEFADFARRLGFAALWDKYGPPDACSKNAAGDYACR
jgi:TolB-like protein/Flp pilus assembly protein TadD